MTSLLKQLYIETRFYAVLAFIVILFVFSFAYGILFVPAKIALLFALSLLLLDILLLFRNGSMETKRELPEKFSNGDYNRVQIYIKSHYTIPLRISLFDEAPDQFQIRDRFFHFNLDAFGEQLLHYELRPTVRGEYRYGDINIVAKSYLRFASRRFIIPAETSIVVYPSFLQMKKYEFLAFDSRIQQRGIKRIRKIGQSREFEQIKHYIHGDDIRFMNWNATARRSEMMLNQFQEETSQSIYSLIDMGRNMKMPFHEMTLLDYAINSTLALSNIALKKYDRAGLISFSHRFDSFLKADHKKYQLQKILDRLYFQETDYLESDFEMLFMRIRQYIYGQSLLMLYTNFQGMASLKRQLPYLKSIARFHILVVIFFENSEIKELSQSKSESLEEIYQVGIAEQLVMEKKQIAKELERNGIHSILTKPEDLSISTINKYLELKAKAII